MSPSPVAETTRSEGCSRRAPSAICALVIPGIAKPSVSIGPREPKQPCGYLPNLNLFRSLRYAVSAETCGATRYRNRIKTGERIRLSVQIAASVSHCVEAVRTCCDTVRSSEHTLYKPMQRGLRDIQVMQSHIIYDLDVAMELHGRGLVATKFNVVLKAKDPEMICHPTC